MPQFKPHNDRQSELIPVSYHQQLHPRTFEFTLYHLILIGELHLSALIARFNNDQTEAGA